MTTLITGGTGLMGAGIAKRLVNRGEKPVLFDIYPAYWRIEDIKDRVTVVRGTVTNLHEVLHVIKRNKVDKVIHLAFFLGAESNADPLAATYVNCIGTLNTYEAGRLLSLERVCVASSIAVYGFDDEYEPPMTASIDSEREVIAPEMSREEYALKVAPWYEEMKYFALPLLISCLVFGLASVGTVLIMTTVRSYFFYKHKGARIHAPPKANRAPLITSTAGALLSYLPFAASIISPDLPIFELILQNPFLYIAASTVLSMLTHFFTNVVHLRLGIRRMVP